ncbi:DNA topoisomerase [Blyttiomyces sp. JEL0837]|nr:DNA topoisomerase [Blyttiomyces sp. JEL0837]
MKVLCVAEKNSVSKAAAEILSQRRFQTKPTKDKYIKNYTFQCNMNGTPCDVVMTSLRGHLCEVDFPPEYKAWDNIPFTACFEAPVIKSVRKDLQDIKSNLQKEARNANMLVIWTDCDLEGENIGAEVMEVCREVNRRIDVKRAKFSVVQEAHINNAWRNLVNLDMNQVEAVNARIELDLRIGAAFTRFQTLRLRPKFQNIFAPNQILSFGSCQFPTLGFVVAQYEKWKRFKPEHFWKIEVFVEAESSMQRFDWARGRLFDHSTAMSIYSLCVESPEARVVAVQAKPKEKWKPLPLTTIEMLKVASSKLRIPSDRAMNIAEKLYTSGLISYPRTETDMFEQDYNMLELIQLQRHDPRWGDFAEGLLNGNYQFPRRGRNNDKAHPPIHPVKASTGDLQPDEKKM